MARPEWWGVHPMGKVTVRNGQVQVESLRLKKGELLITVPARDNNGRIPSWAARKILLVEGTNLHWLPLGTPVIFLGRNRTRVRVMWDNKICEATILELGVPRTRRPH